MKNLFVGNLSFKCEDIDLQEHFEVNKITPLKVSVIRDRETGKGKGFGFVEVQDADFDKALELDGKTMTCSGASRVLNVNEAQSKDRGNSRAARR